MTGKDKDVEAVVAETEYVPPVVLPPDDASVDYPIPDPDYAPPVSSSDPAPKATTDAPKHASTSKG
jgi:hypothetical protein